MSLMLLRAISMMPKAAVNAATGPGAPGTIATWDSAYKGSGITLTFTNSRARQTVASYQSARSTVAMVSGKWCFEYTVIATDTLYLGVTNAVTGDFVVGPSNAMHWGFTGNIVGATGTNLSNKYFAANDTLTLAVDLTARTVVCYKNGVLQGTVNAPATGNLYAYFIGSNSGVGAEATLNNTAVAYPVAGYTNGLYNT